MFDITARHNRSRLIRGTVAGLAVGLLTLMGLGLYADFAKLDDAIGSFDPMVIAPVLALSLANYGVRALRWNHYLAVAGASVPRGLSLGVFLGGLAMSITPGKFGEVIKVGLLNEGAGIPPSRSFPVVVTERLTDLIAVLVLTGAGVAVMGQGIAILAGGIVLTCLFYLVLATGPGMRMTFAVAARVLRGKVGPDMLDEARVIQGRLLAPRPLAAGLSMGMIAWFAEALGLYLVVNAFPGGDLSVQLATFIYATGTLAGALSVLPGGLIATEATLAGMLSPAVFGALPDEAAVAAATIIVRAATLWFAVAIGAVGLTWVYRRLRTHV